MTNVFKMVEDKECVQIINATIGSRGMFAYLPDPVCCFNDSVFKQTQTYRLEQGASLILVDWYCSGRKDRDDFWGANRITNRLMVYEDEDLVLLENLDLHTNEFGKISEKVGGAMVFGMLILSGNMTKEARNRLQCFATRRSFHDQRAEILHNSQSSVNSSATLPWMSITNLTAETSILRFSVPSVEYGYGLLVEALEPLASAFDGSSPFADRRHYQQYDPAEDHPHDPINTLRMQKPVHTSVF
jgi:hypothetical protein